MFRRDARACLIMIHARREGIGICGARGARESISILVFDTLAKLILFFGIHHKVPYFPPFFSPPFPSPFS